MGLLIWKIIRNLVYYGLFILIIVGASYTGVLGGIYAIIMQTYGGVADFLGKDFTNLIFGVTGIIIIFAIIGIFYERD